MKSKIKKISSIALDFERSIFGALDFSCAAVPIILSPPGMLEVSSFLPNIQ
jgi:hypothetical protein